MAKMLTYYAFNERPDGKLQQILVSMPPLKFSERTEAVTGVTYKTAREAKADMARLNGATGSMHC